MNDNNRLYKKKKKKQKKTKGTKSKFKLTKKNS